MTTITNLLIEKFGLPYATIKEDVNSMRDLILDTNTQKVLALCEEKYTVKYNKEGKDIKVEVLTKKDNLVAGFSLLENTGYALNNMMSKAVLFLIG